MKKNNFNNTDVGNSKRLVLYHGEKLRYCYSVGCWFVWNGQYWEKDDGGIIETLAKDTVKKIYEEAEKEDYDRQSVLIKHAIASESRQKINNMISLAQSEHGIPVMHQELGGDHWKLNCQNGVIDLKTGELLSHNRDYLMTHMIPVDYDPNADCPNWKSFLTRIMQDENGVVREGMIPFLQQAIGYSLTGSIKEQVMFVLYGSGRNGKSTFINVIKDLLGDYAKQASTDTFMSKLLPGGIPNDLARLKGARLVSAVESEEGKRLAESLVKQLTGGEPITARFLHKEFFEFTPTFKIFFVTNHKPQIRGADEGIWRRIRLIPFDAVISPDEMDKDLPEKLCQEMPGILKWAVDGCLLWQSKGLSMPAEVTAATQGYRSEMDSLKNFIDDHCVINPNACVTTSNLYNQYRQWCTDNGEFPFPMKKFKLRLRERLAVNGIIVNDFRTKDSRGWQGIGLIHETDLPNIVKDNSQVIHSQWEEGEI